MNAANVKFKPTIRIILDIPVFSRKKSRTLDNFLIVSFWAQWILVCTAFQLPCYFFFIYTNFYKLLVFILVIDRVRIIMIFIYLIVCVGVPTLKFANNLISCFFLSWNQRQISSGCRIQLISTRVEDDYDDDEWW